MTENKKMALTLSIIVAVVILGGIFFLTGGLSIFFDSADDSGFVTLKNWLR